MNKCPCEECITLAVCRSRNYHGQNGLLRVCDKLCKYLSIGENSTRHKKRIKTLCKIMKPVHWELGEEIRDGTGYNILRKGNK